MLSMVVSGNDGIQESALACDEGSERMRFLPICSQQPAGTRTKYE